MEKQLDSLVLYQVNVDIFEYGPRIFWCQIFHTKTKGLLIESTLNYGGIVTIPLNAWRQYVRA